MHVFDWPRDGKLCVGGLLTEVKGAYLQSNPQRTLKVARMGEDVMIDVPTLCLIRLMQWSFSNVKES